VKKNIEAWSFAESDGYGVSAKCSHVEAYEAIKIAMRESDADSESDDARIADTLKLEDVKASRLYKHRSCDVGTIGDSDECYDCGEPHSGVGRPIFVWHRQ
jgi:hypothetical protein